MRIREYGASGPPVLVLHGGPGAPGYMAPLARELADSFGVLEPFQRGSGGERLTVARHLADLHEVVESGCGSERPALVGHSWGAMLALAYAAAHPGCAASLVLIGCGTFDPAARDHLRAIREQRTDERLRRRIQSLPEEYPDPDERLGALGNLLLPLYSYELVAYDDEVEAYDARAHHEAWEDMVRLQEEGAYPAAFSAIRAPAIMLHGVIDPHPGRMVRTSLEPHLPHLEYREWECCGHYPWLEKAIRQEFLAFLRGWLLQHFAGDSVAAGQPEWPGSPREGPAHV